MTLCAQVVYFIRLNVIDQFDQIGAVSQVTVMKLHLSFGVCESVLVQVFNSSLKKVLYFKTFSQMIQFLKFLLQTSTPLIKLKSSFKNRICATINSKILDIKMQRLTLHKRTKKPFDTFDSMSTSIVKIILFHTSVALLLDKRVARAGLELCMEPVGDSHSD
ncbi:hypothetical protein BpHYR1_019795 [Brachionus plicatilis]|uniref:Uncharacterized protein n=1 Tax=Brachionus plicatilis TaxID=10195 RepID=A0A3M7T6C1_BRAPC|nr:hypothetical protein BpHYR1_019795 [Brachionus plicatilis]